MIVPIKPTAQKPHGSNNTLDPMAQQSGDTKTQPFNHSTRSWFHFVRYWLPALCCMALIFFFSSLSGSSLSNLGSLDVFVKKGAHITEYAILYFLLFRAFQSLMVARKALIVSAVIAVLYAISDEYHQTFVPLREGTVRDVFIDSIGIFLVYLYLRRRHAH
jgi:VanZ family protein